MELHDFVFIVLESIPVDDYLLYPLPPYFHPFFGAIPIILDLLGLRAKTFNHSHELGDEIGNSTGVLGDILLDDIQFFELG